MALHERCPSCSRRLIVSRFDTTFRMSDRSEQLHFGILTISARPAAALHRSRPDRAARARTRRCVFAIESDLAVQEQARSI
jgi:hypothetical protein